MPPASHVLDRPVGPFTGVGLFTGRSVSMTIAPGAGDGWIHFSRVESGRVAAGGGADVRAVVADTSWSGLPAGVPIRNTTLDATIGRSVLDPLPASPGPVVATVEHVLAALAGLGVWEAHVTLDGPEVPILDGSAAPFVGAILPALRPAPRAPEPITLASRVEVRAGDAVITAEPLAPGRAWSYTYDLDYGPGSPIPPQRAAWHGSTTEFARAIAPARTFSLLAEARAAQAAGLFRHLTPRDMLVVGDDGAPVDNAWRLDHEPARHKLLDLIGDLALLRRPLHARVLARRSGHALTHAFCRAVLAAT